MRIEWSDIVTFTRQNRGWMLFNTGLLVTSAVKVMPLPDQPFRFYQFCYDWLHQFLNLPNLRLTAGPIITPPESSPNSQPKQP